MSNQNDWWVGETQHKDKKYYIRALQQQPNTENISQYKTLITIKWKFAQTENGFPNIPDTLLMNRFEELLEAGIENKKIAIKISCITGNNIRIWNYYSIDHKQFLTTFNQLLTTHPAYPLQIKATYDPYWTTLQKIIAKK